MFKNPKIILRTACDELKHIKNAKCDFFCKFCGISVDCYVHQPSSSFSKLDLKAFCAFEKIKNIKFCQNNMDFYKSQVKKSHCATLKNRCLLTNTRAWYKPINVLKIILPERSDCLATLAKNLTRVGYVLMNLIRIGNKLRNSPINSRSRKISKSSGTSEVTY